MPIESAQLRYKPPAFAACPRCRARPFDHLLRGQVQSWWRSLFNRPYCAVICSACKHIVGWEKP